MQLTCESRSVSRVIYIDKNVYYNGYFGHHGYIAQCAVFPDGMMTMSLPMPAGFDTDWSAWQNLPMKNQLQDINGQRNVNGEDPVALFGDAIYNDNPPGLLAQHRKRRGIALAPWQLEENSVLKTPRASVEHVFGKIKERTTSFRDFTNKMKVGSTYPLKAIILAVAWGNIHTIIAGGQTPLTYPLRPLGEKPSTFRHRRQPQL